MVMVQHHIGVDSAIMYLGSMSSSPQQTVFTYLMCNVNFLQKRKNNVRSLQYCLVAPYQHSQLESDTSFLILSLLLLKKSHYPQSECQMSPSRFCAAHHLSLTQLLLRAIFYTFECEAQRHKAEAEKQNVEQIGSPTYKKKKLSALDETFHFILLTTSICYVFFLLGRKIPKPRLSHIHMKHVSTCSDHNTAIFKVKIRKSFIFQTKHANSYPLFGS